MLYFMQFRQGGESEVRSALDAKKGIGLKPQWTNEQAKAQRIEYAAGAPKPMKLTRAEAMALESQITEKEKSKKRGLPTSINKEYILSPEYKAKFRGISKNTKTDELICQKARDMLIHRNNTYYEDMYLFDEIKGSVVATQTHSNKPQEIVYNLSLETAIKKHRPNFLISLHNHPESKPPSGDDLASCGMRKYQKGLICCHNGDVYIYQTGKKPFTANLFDATVDKYKKRGYTEISAYEQTLNQFQEDYGIRWEKR
ncbi:hypothetical protein [uncultured Ruminococcus sp.]|uniref:hypothetical protein n=1 Tax=uncultured Ruminococcus sp. TaxID=165186 RepID=UPI0025DB097A|nr:hypothetical protein [uncultured Ruminococcus sp.]